MMPSHACKSGQLVFSCVPSYSFLQAVQVLGLPGAPLLPKLAVQQAAELPALQEPLQTSYASCRPGPALHNLHSC